MSVSFVMISSRSPSHMSRSSGPHRQDRTWSADLLLGYFESAEGNYNFCSPIVQDNCAEYLMVPRWCTRCLRYFHSKAYINLPLASMRMASSMERRLQTTALAALREGLCLACIMYDGGFVSSGTGARSCTVPMVPSPGPVRDVHQSDQSRNGETGYIPTVGRRGRRL